MCLMELYPYQKKIVDEAIKNFKTVNKQMIVIPTGGGKTVIFCHIAKKLGLKTLVVAHTKELIDQCKRTSEKIGTKNLDIISIQQCGIRVKHKTLDHYDFLIVDECHRGGANTYQNLISYLTGSKILGVTATPFRHDGQKLLDIFGKKIAPLNLLEMIRSNLLSDFQGFRVTTDCSLKGIKTKNGDFSAAHLSAVVNVKNRNALIVKEYQKLALGEKALCFAVNVKHSNELAMEFVKNGIPSISLHGGISKTSRMKAIKNFKEGSIQVMVNCQVLTEGFDEPSISCLLLARPTTSKILYTQMIGRGSRLWPGKKICKVIEFTDNEYDVSCMEELIGGNPKVFRMNQGEHLSGMGTRLEKILLETGNKTFINEISIVPRSIYEKPASMWQRSYLMERRIQFTEPLTEFIANQLITRESNGSN
jgi:ATP-dependent helicase IRC3